MVKIPYEVPRKMIEAAQDPHVKNSPHNLCSFCPARNVTCSGANERFMDMPAQIAYWNTLGRVNQISRPHAAEIANLPLSTLNSIFSGRTPDPRHGTLKAISLAYNGGNVVNSPCHMASLLLNGQIKDSAYTVSDETARLRDRLKKIQADADYRLEKAEKEAATQIEYLKGQVEAQRKEKRFVQTIAIILAAFVIFLFAIDLLVGTVGWFRF